MRRILVTLCYLALSAPALAADAPHVQQRIVPGQAIGKVAIGQTLAQVKNVLGGPEGVIEKRRLGFGKTFVEYSWRPRILVRRPCARRGAHRPVKLYPESPMP